LDGGNLDGIVEGTEAVFEAKFMLPWSFSEEAAADADAALSRNRLFQQPARTRSRTTRSPRKASASQPDSERPQQIAHLARFWSRAPKSALSRHSCFPSAGGGFPATTGG
jgi:hypothetical protein